LTLSIERSKLLTDENFTAYVSIPNANDPFEKGRPRAVSLENLIGIISGRFTFDFRTWSDNVNQTENYIVTPYQVETLTSVINRLSSNIGEIQ